MSDVSVPYWTDLWCPRGSALDVKSADAQQLANLLAHVALQRHAVVCHRATNAARALEIPVQIGEERRIVRQPEDDGDGLAATAFLLHAKLRGWASGNRLARGGSTAAPAFRLSAPATDLSRRARIDHPDVVALFHDEWAAVA
jgi:hypothetical protein